MSARSHKEQPTISSTTFSVKRLCTFGIISDEKKPAFTEEIKEVQRREGGRMQYNRNMLDYTMSYGDPVNVTQHVVPMTDRPATSRCYNQLFVNVPIPNPPDENDRMELHLCEEYLEVTSKEHYLKLFLPHPINTDESEARFCPECLCVHVVLEMAQEFVVMEF